LKKLALLSALIVAGIAAIAQQDPAVVILKDIETLPAFKMAALPDSTIFSSGQLQKNKAVIIMFFNPDCSHCQNETKELLAYKQELKDIQIVMVSSLSMKLIKEFYADYNIASMPNIIMGQDINYALRIKFRPTNFPGIYVYDAKGKLAKAFAGNAGVPAMLDALK